MTTNRNEIVKEEVAGRIKGTFGLGHRSLKEVGKEGGPFFERNIWR